METKKQIRAHYKALRDALTPEAAANASEKICAQILSWDVYKKAERIYFYYPLGKEVSLLPVISDALLHGKKAAFPKVSGMDMSFYEISDVEELSAGCFHVMEPRIEGKMPVAWDCALCFVPGIVFDRQGGRFGYGKGYYDRYFEQKNGVLLAGCAYQIQIVDMLPTESFDRRMDYLVWENDIYRTRDAENRINRCSAFTKKNAGKWV